MAYPLAFARGIQFLFAITAAIVATGCAGSSIFAPTANEVADLGHRIHATASPRATATASASPSPSPTATASGSPASSSTPSRAADFLNSMGVNVHLEGGGGGIYTQANLNTMLAATGLQYLRDTVDVATAYTSMVKSVNASYGAKWDWITDTTQTVASLQNAVNTAGLAATVSGEGANECDINASWPGCDTSSYPQAETQAQQTLYTAMRGISSSIQVLGPSEATQDEDANYNVGNLSAYLDYGVTHDYFGWHDPESLGWGGSSSCGVYAADSYALCLAKVISGGKPIQSTESGWLDLGTSGGVPPAVKADYVGRLYAFHWAEGVPRTYYFELADYTQTYGLFNTSAQPKPAANEVANLRSILSDSSTSFTPSDSIGVRVTPPSGGYTLLLQKANGSEYLLYWMGCEEFSGTTNTNEACPTQSSTVSFVHVPTAITSWVLNAAGGGEKTSSSLTPAASLTLTFTDHLQILQLQP